MNDSQGPPQHYPSSQESTIEIFRFPHVPVTAHDRGGSQRRARNFSRNEGPRSDPPAYSAGNAPPQYQDPHHHHHHHNSSHSSHSDQGDLQPYGTYHQLLRQQQLQQIIESPRRDSDVDEEEAAKNYKKTIRNRLAASLLIVVTVALVVAGAVGRITSVKSHEHHLGDAPKK